MKDMIRSKNIVKKEEIQMDETKMDNDASPSNFPVCFQFVKTLKPDIYDIYLKNEENIIKVGICGINDMKSSRLVRKAFANADDDDEVCFKCVYNKEFKKWTPTEISNSFDDNKKMKYIETQLSIN